MRRIKLTKGKWATVDDRFYDALVAMGSWHCDSDDYARRWPGIRMHRAIMKLAGIKIPPGFEVDHRDGRRRNNQLRNLRSANQSQQAWNRKKQSNSSGVKGVRRHRGTGKWEARISVGGKQLYLGLFASKREAARVYRSAASKHHGEFARASFDGKAA